MKKIAIFGDNCVDAYWIGTAHGLSAEAAVPVIKQTRILSLPGMAGNVQKILQDLGGVETTLFQPLLPHLPIKNRLMTESGEQLARWDIEDWCAPVEVDTLMPGIPEEFSAAIICDYQKGAVDSCLASRLRSYAEQGLPLFIDTKRDPFIWLGVPQATLFPNDLEYSQWKSHYDWMPSVVHKMGADGIEFLSYGKRVGSLAANAPCVRNVCGAGDSVIAAYAYAQVILGRDIEGSVAFAIDISGEFVSRPRI